ncbi:aminoglycoside phosphotransferase family protein [Streptomyces sp. JH14]|uniref:phosphotransferase n=1 Tax=Streptomyces sp. JH14 TaxID=2793630 RepID=UPI0023F89D14|nr:phosphotransferase [Streptomyces sp. JH14]MDF6043296.1 aminoglycoside phosphotransferase family protein [Streptomyces sp. JH14]
MEVPLESGVKRRAADMFGLPLDHPAIEGPLKGHHHEAYAVPLPGGGRAKYREPREGLLWFDRRCFALEEELLRDLQGRVTRIPEVLDYGVLLQRFIEGRTLGVGVASETLSPKHRTQLGELFGELASLGIDDVAARRICDDADRPVDGDSHGFLTRLINFTEQRVYQEHGVAYHGLLAELGVREGALDGLKKSAETLTGRTFTLLHGDLHGLNLIVDEQGDLWAVDWELAMIGDPLYDLATHLHLMRYSRKEAERVTGLWRRAVESRRPECVKGWEVDLDVLRDYKRAQSVYTDVIRAALALSRRPPELNLDQLQKVAGRVQQALAAARRPLGLQAVPTLRQVAAAYATWFTSHSDTVAPSAS